MVTDTEIRARNLLDRAWRLVAHADSWAVADPEWRAEAERWRDAYHDFIARSRISGDPPEAGRPGGTPGPTGNQAKSPPGSGSAMP